LGRKWFCIAELEDSMANPVSQFNFRQQALAGNLPGVKKASW